MKKILTILLLMFMITILMSVTSATDVNSTIESQSRTNIQQENQQDNIFTSSIKKDETYNKNTKRGTESELDDETVGTGCATTLIQGYNNDSALSFRRDATNKLTINVKYDNSIIKQYKEGSYFFHAIVSKDGWMVGNGGADNAQVNHAIENNALSMINKNTITYENMNNIYKQESKLILGHFVIKAPNGTYSLIIKNNGRTFRDSGVLMPGQCMVVPNSIYYFKKNTVNDINTEAGMITSSRLLAARDGYGVNRREIFTYYYKNNRVNSTVKVSVTNDNGHHVGRRTGGLIDNIRTNTKYFSSSSIPVIDNSLHLETVNFFIRKTRTSVVTKNIRTNTGKVELIATVKDEFGHNVNTGKVSFEIDGKTLKYSNGNVIYAKINNSTVKYNTKILNLWDKKKHKYSINYVGNSVYENSKSNNASITVEEFFTIKSKHYTNVFYGGKLSIKTTIKYNGNNTGVTGGKVFYKINGKTILNSKNTTLYKKPKDGKTVYNYTFNTKYWTKTYVLTTIYINGAYRKEYKTNITIKKIPVKIVSHNITVNRNVLHFTGKLVDKYNKTLKYQSYITAKINNKTIKTNNTPKKFNIKNGNVNFKFTIPNKYRAQKYILTINIPKFKETLSYNRNYTVKV